MASKQLVSHHVQGNLVEQRVADGYVNATALCKAAGKRVNNYLRADSTKAFVKALEVDTRIRATELIQVVRGGFPEIQGTWVHPRVAIHLGQWLSPRFAVRMTGIVFDWMDGLRRHQAMERLLLPSPDEWEKRFPDEFWMGIYRLKGIPWPGMSKNRPQWVGAVVNDLVWDRVGAAGLREELDNRNPRQQSGERERRHHQDLRDPAVIQLYAHLSVLMGLMMLSTDWASFMDKVRIVRPKLHENRPLPF